jgi:hypothetical protein
MEFKLENCTPITVMVLSLLFSFLFAEIVQYFVNMWRFRVLINQLPRGPRPLPLVGNALSLMGRFDCIQIIAFELTILILSDVHTWFVNYSI